MKSILLRSLAAAAVALGLAACGGGDDADYEIKGTIVGLQHSGLTLSNNGGDTISVPSGAKEFRFPKKMGYGEIYQVKVEKSAEHQNCEVASPKMDGVAGREVVGRLTKVDVLVRCSLQVHTVTVSIPKPAPGVVLTNGSLGGTHTLTATTTAVDFPVTYGDAYGITVLEPKGSPCRVENGVGVMGDQDVKGVTLVCP